MSKHNVSSRAVCPFYKHEDPQVIYCEGLYEGSVIHLAFAERGSCRTYKWNYCRAAYGKCPICMALTQTKTPQK